MAGEHIVYRASPAALGGLGALMVASTVTLLVRVSAGGFGGDMLLLVAGSMVAIFGFLLALAVGAITVVTDGGVTVRHLFGSRHYPWAEITDIRIAPMVGTGARSAALYDTNQRQVFLSQVTDRLLGPEGLDHEVGELRRRWNDALPPPDR